MSEELKPCPFCGSSDLAVMELLSRGLRIECEGCGACSPVIKDGPALLTAWNTRVVDHPPTTNPVVDHETGNTSDKLRPSIMDTLWPILGGNHTDAETWEEIAAVIEADRQATRAALVAEIVAWLEDYEPLLVDMIEAKWGKQ